MRRPIFATPTEAAVALFASRPTFELASTTDDGSPLLRTLHGVVVDGALAFHGSPVGEKLEVVGRRAVAATSVVVASLPSHFLDPERACPATTLYESAQAHGIVQEVTEPSHKARVLHALMEKLQPEGGYVPIDSSHPLYERAVAKIAVLQLPLDRVDGKAKLLQHRSPADRAVVLERLWARGAAGDARAIERILAASPGGERPAFLRGPAATTLHVALSPGDASSAAALLEGTYWNDEFTADELERAHDGSSGWVGAKDAAGVLVASARALSDGAKRAWIWDVVVRPDLQGRGLGDAVMRLLLAHPAVRCARRVQLGTRDAMAFYERLGFVDLATVQRPYRTTLMVLGREPPPRPLALALSSTPGAARIDELGS